VVLNSSFKGYSIAASDSETANLASSETGERVFSETYVLQPACGHLSGLAG
jgi:hypothetical protein